MPILLLLALLLSACTDATPVDVPPTASLVEITGDPRLDGAVLESLRPCDYIQVMLEENGSEHPEGRIIETGPATELQFKARATTLADLDALLEQSANVRLVGAFDPATELDESDRFLTEIYSPAGCK